MRFAVRNRKFLLRIKYYKGRPNSKHILNNCWFYLLSSILQRHENWEIGLVITNLNIKNKQTDSCQYNVLVTQTSSHVTRQLFATNHLIRCGFCLNLFCYLLNCTKHPHINLWKVEHRKNVILQSDDETMDLEGQLFRNYHFQYSANVYDFPIKRWTPLWLASSAESSHVRVANRHHEQ